MFTIYILVGRLVDLGDKNHEGHRDGRDPDLPG